MRITGICMARGVYGSGELASFTVELDQELMISGITLTAEGDKGYDITYPGIICGGKEISFITPLTMEMAEDIYMQLVNFYIRHKDDVCCTTDRKTENAIRDAPK